MWTWTFTSPQPGQLEIYLDALARLNAVVAFKLSDEDAREKVRGAFILVGYGYHSRRPVSSRPAQRS